MKRLIEWRNLDHFLTTAAILVLVLVESCNGGGEESSNSTSGFFPGFDSEVTGNYSNATQGEWFLHDLASTFDSDVERQLDQTRPNISETLEMTLNDTGGSRGQNGRRSRSLLSWLDSSDCTLDAIIREMVAHNGVPALSSRCHSRHFVLGRQVPTSEQTTLRSGFSFNLSAVHSSASIVNASIQLPVQLVATNMSLSSVRITFEVQVTGQRAAVYRGSVSERFRRRLFPVRKCFHVSVPEVVQTAVSSGNGSLVVNVQVVTKGAGGDQFGGQINQPFMAIDSFRERGCSTRLSDTFPDGVP